MNRATVERVQTARLLCERLRPEHAEELSRLWSDPRVAAWLQADGRPPSDSEMADGHALTLLHWEMHGFGWWLLRDRFSGAMVGHGGLKTTRVLGRDEVEVAWAIVPERWRQGLASEMASAALEVAFGPLGLDQVVALTLPDNVASRRVMEKCGFVYDRDIEYAGLPHVLYRRGGEPVTTRQLTSPIRRSSS